MTRRDGQAVLYRHTQVGGVVLAVVGLSALLVGGLLVAAGYAAVAWVITGFLLLMCLLFGWMTVEVRRDDVRFRLGIGLVRRVIPLSSVATVRPVRNRWWYGWGIRRIPHGWLYNVSGLDAVELGLRDGTHVRIGTDEPGALSRWIEARGAV